MECSHSIPALEWSRIEFIKLDISYKRYERIERDFVYLNFKIFYTSTDNLKFKFKIFSMLWMFQISTKINRKTPNNLVPYNIAPLQILNQKYRNYYQLNSNYTIYMKILPQPYLTIYRISLWMMISMRNYVSNKM